MVYGPPTPAEEGVNVFPLIPGPLNVPPDGDPVNVTGGEVTAQLLANPENETVGNGLTVIVAEELVFVHPLPSVYV